MPGKGVSMSKGEGDESLLAKRLFQGKRREGPLPWIGGTGWEAP